MAWQTLPVVVGLRSLGRHTGLNRLLCALAPKTEYEQQFDQELLRRVRGGTALGMLAQTAVSIRGSSFRQWDMRPSDSI